MEDKWLIKNKYILLMVRMTEVRAGRLRVKKGVFIVKVGKAIDNRGPRGPLTYSGYGLSSLRGPGSGSGLYK